MITKSFYNNGRTCRVTFRHQPVHDADSVYLVNNQDDWDKTARPMSRRKDGSFSTSLVLRSGTRFQFRYLVDGDTWVNDDQADEYVDKNYGGTDGVVVI